MLAQRARDNLAAVAFCALVGGQDELVFDGHSFVVDHDGRRDRPRAAVRRGPAGLRRRPRRPRASARLRDTRQRPAAREVARRGRPARDASTGGAARRRLARRPGGARRARCSTGDAEVYAALVLGTRDYVRKNGFEHVVLGLSGGIDSTLVALRRRRRARRRPRHRA